MRHGAITTTEGGILTANAGEPPRPATSAITPATAVAATKAPSLSSFRIVYLAVEMAMAGLMWATLR